MAVFDIQRIRWGYESRPPRYYIAISDIRFDEGDEVVYIPDNLEGEPITNLGYGQKYTPPYERFHDWHHPSQGSELVEGNYSFSYNTINVPAFVKKIVIPASINDICYCAFKFLGNTEIEIDEGNTVYAVKNEKIVSKKTGRTIDV
jgi:hypothetical protein